MLAHANDGAVLFCATSSESALPSFRSVMTASGYTDDEPSDVEVAVHRGAGGVCLALAGTKDVALALGRALSRRVGGSVRVLTVSAVERGDDFTCAVDDVTIGVDGKTSPGRWAADVASECGGDWGRFCDGKFFFAVHGVLAHAIGTVLPDAREQPALSFHFPRSLGSPRLDDLVQRARLAEHAELTEMGGRACIRIKIAGSTVTSFVDPDEAAALRGALGT